MSEAPITLPIGLQVSLPGYLDTPVVLEGVRHLAKGYECRVRLPGGTPNEFLIPQFSIMPLEHAGHVAARERKEHKDKDRQCKGCSDAAIIRRLDYPPVLFVFLVIFRG